MCIFDSNEFIFYVMLFEFWVDDDIIYIFNLFFYISIC